MTSGYTNAAVIFHKNVKNSVCKSFQNQNCLNTVCSYDFKSKIAKTRRILDVLISKSLQHNGRKVFEKKIAKTQRVFAFLVVKSIKS